MEYCKGCTASEGECAVFCLREEVGYCTVHGKLFVGNLTCVPVCPDCYAEDAAEGLCDGDGYPNDAGDACELRHS